VVAATLVVYPYTGRLVSRLSRFTTPKGIIEREVKEMGFPCAGGCGAAVNARECFCKGCLWLMRTGRTNEEGVKTQHLFRTFAMAVENEREAVG
jgi:hypothetical protein